MTHKDRGVKKGERDAFIVGLRHDLKIEYVFEIENYTVDNQNFDAKKHEEILEALYQCTIVADRMMKHAEAQGLCSIL